MLLALGRTWLWLVAVYLAWTVRAREQESVIYVTVQKPGRNEQAGGSMQISGFGITVNDAYL